MSRPWQESVTNPDERVKHFSYRVTLVVSALVACDWQRAAKAAEVSEVWEGQPYQIEASLAIEAPGDLRAQLERDLPGFLRKRASTAIGSVWRLQAEPADGALRHAVLRGVDRLSDEDLPEAKDTEDKRLLLAIRATPWGYEISAREFDRYLHRWGPPLRRTVRQRDAVPEQLFALAERAVAPLAYFTPSSSDPERVSIELRGADLPPAGAGDFAWLVPGDALQPLLVRKNRDGSVALGGVATIPWTYIEVVEPADKPAELTGRIRSATAHPLGGRRGRVEAVAIGMRNYRAATTLELRARDEQDKPLAGYEVFVQNDGDKQLQRIGKSDARGEVRVEPGQSAVRSLYLQNDGVTLARLPIVPGAEPRVTVHLPDDEMRLRAAARLSAIREDIVDVVARRTIFMARVRQQIAEKNFDEARQLLSALEELPGTLQFRRDIERSAQLMRTRDPQVQRRIDKLFSDTRNALGKFLNPQPIGALYEELRQAELQSQAAPKSDEAS